MPELWLTVTQAAEVSGYHPNSIRRLIAQGAIEARKFGPIWQVNRQSLAAYVRKVGKRGEKRGPKVGA